MKLVISNNLYVLQLLLTLPLTLFLNFPFYSCHKVRLKMDQKGPLSERSEFRTLPIFSLILWGFSYSRRRFFLVTFFGEAKKVTSCRTTPDL